jgi:hypothetical protein
VWISRSSRKANRIIAEAEQKKMAEGGIVVVEGVKHVIGEIVGRKKLKQSYEYEVSFKNLSSTENIWFPCDELIQRGFEKKVVGIDTRKAQCLSLPRPLVHREIEKRSLSLFMLSLYPMRHLLCELAHTLVLRPRYAFISSSYA